MERSAPPGGNRPKTALRIIDGESKVSLSPAVLHPLKSETSTMVTVFPYRYVLWYHSLGSNERRFN